MAAEVISLFSDDPAAFAESVIRSERSPPDKRPLFRPLPPASVFPIDSLGPLKDAASAICDRTQAPMAIAAQSVLAAATLAAQAHRDVTLPGNLQRPLTGLFLTVADSGERKSSVDRLATAAVLSVESDLRCEWERALPIYANEKAAWESAQHFAKRAHKGDRAAIKKALDEIGAEPKKPAHPMLLVGDPTPEALSLHLAERPSAGVFTAEGGILVGGAAFNDESRMRTSALMNTLWDGEPIRRIRVGTGVTYLPGRRCSAHIMMQHVVANRILGDSLFEGIGLLARMLIVAPESTAGTRFFRHVSNSDSVTLGHYDDRLRLLLTRKPATIPFMPDALCPPAMQLHHEAASAWIGFHDMCEREIAPHGQLAGIRPFGAKLAEHAGRLAGVLSVYSDPDCMTVPLWAVNCGIQLATYYGAEMLRVHCGATVSAELQAAELLLNWMQKQGQSEFHLASIYQNGPQSMRDAKSAKRAADTLVQHGHLEALPADTLLDGVARRQAWRLIP